MPLRLAPALGFLALCALLGGCASDALENSPRDAQQLIDTETVRVIATNPTFIEGESGAGVPVGGLVGGLVGSAFGGGTGKIFTVLAGGIVGAALGSEVSRNVTTEPATEYLLERGDGSRITVIQPEQPAIASGTVAILQTRPDGWARVAPYRG